MADCVFCQIVNGKIPADKVFENESFIVILDIHPASKGHSLVIPKKHVDRITDMDDQLLGEMAAVAKKVANGMQKSLGADGINFMVNNGKVAGQLIDHAHMHVIPRFSADKIDFGWNPHKYEANEIKELAERIRNSIRII